MSIPAPRRPMTPDEHTIIRALRGVRMLPASWEKRFRNYIVEAEEMDAPISDKASKQAWRLFKRYRRQTDCPEKPRLLSLAEQLAAPDLKKQNAAMREQAEIDRLKAQYAEQMAQKKDEAQPEDSAQMRMAI